ncbi:MAG: nucleotidyl transferase AbiEii/AbiGii toxin family protein [Candidatus Margulisbacteria bacterium]|nr:nucleotidyl transferase AbiEii/AbiGii toxin family protein [Candidatus Margulisiibacteriota bacterium]
MIYFQEILDCAKGLPAEIIEKDYCLTWLLEGISDSSLSKYFVFYGGTALKKIYFPNFRFSEDLDFLSKGAITKEKILIIFNEVYHRLQKKININYFTKKETVALKEDRLQFFVGYDGFPEINIAKQIKMDINMGQKPIEKALNRKIFSPYSDKKEIQGGLPTYSMEAIAAEKLSAIFDLARKEPRDIYDLNYLLKQPSLNYKLVMALLRKKYGFSPPSSAILLNIRSDIYRQRWELRLKSQIIKPGKIDAAIHNLETAIKKLYLNPSSLV